MAGNLPSGARWHYLLHVGKAADRERKAFPSLGGLQKGSVSEWHKVCHPRAGHTPGVAASLDLHAAWPQESDQDVEIFVLPGLQWFQQLCRMPTQTASGEVYAFEELLARKEFEVMPL